MYTMRISLSTLTIRTAQNPLLMQQRNMVLQPPEGEQINKDSPLESDLD
jgi:hypothetical protein